MTSAAPHSTAGPFMLALKRMSAIFGKVTIGIVLLVAASVVALITAFAGLMLAGAALIMRYAAARTLRPVPATGEADDGMTLDARPTPRGWTVE